MQEICRFKIRQTIRQAIEKDNADYYKVKRDMSTYNKNRHVSSKSTRERRGRTFYGVEQDDDEDDDDDGESNNEHDIYDTDEDDELAGDEQDAESSGETRAATNANTNALARFERILRPRIGLNISYARFDRLDNHLRLLIGILFFY